MSQAHQPLAVLSEVRPLAEAEFGLYQKLVFREAGIHLGEVKMALVAARLLRRASSPTAAKPTALKRKAQEQHAMERPLSPFMFPTWYRF